MKSHVLKGPLSTMSEVWSAVSVVAKCTRTICKSVRFESLPYGSYGQRIGAVAASKTDTAPEVGLVDVT